MEWLQLQPISRQESGFVEDARDERHTFDDDAFDDALIHLAHLRADLTSRRSLTASGKARFGRKWKFLSRKSSWRSL